MNGDRSNHATGQHRGHSACRKEPPEGFTSRIMIETALRRLVVFGAFALLAYSVVSRSPYPYAATPAPPQVKTAEPEYLTPVELKFSPDGQRIYVVCEGNDSVLAIDARTQRVVAHVKVGSKPRGLAVSPNGKTLYVSNSWSDTVSEIDAGSLQVRRTLKPGWTGGAHHRPEWKVPVRR